MSSQLAPVTSESDWDHLNTTIRLIGNDIKNLHKKITSAQNPKAEADRSEENVPEPERDLDPAVDVDQQQLDDNERERRFEQEVDGVPDGDYDRDAPYPDDPDEPEMGG